jgi:hypothetical protein
MPFARASELDRLLACPGSLVLPRTNEKSERAVQAAEWGTRCHFWKETGEFGVGREALTLKKKVENSGVRREELWSQGLHEVPLAYNVETGEARALVVPLHPEEKGSWKTAFGDSWVTGTADYVGFILDGPWVDDLKTGRKVEYVDHRFQQAFYVMTWGLSQLRELRPGRSTLTHWPKYPLGEKPRRFGTVLEPGFFQEFQDRLRNLYRDWKKLKEKGDTGMDITGHLQDGGHCLYCPSKPSCTKGSRYE